MIEQPNTTDAPVYWLDMCPVCEQKAVMGCKCPVNERTCPNRHTWYWDKGQKVIGSWHEKLQQQKHEHPNGATDAIRLKHGHIDDIVLTGDTLRLEDLQSNLWWLALYRGERHICFYLRSDTPITVEIVENGLGVMPVERVRQS